MVSKPAVDLPAGMPLERSSVGAVKSAAEHREKVEQAAVQFEGMFIAQMLNEMRRANEQMQAENGLQDQAGAAILEHAYRAVADELAEQRAFGIADMLVAQMLPSQAAGGQQRIPSAPDFSKPKIDKMSNES